MSANKTHRSPSGKGLGSGASPQKAQQSSSGDQGKSAGQLQGEKSAKGKNTAAYWNDRIFKDVTRGVESPHYSMQVSFKGRRMTFSLGSSNKEGAAVSAAGIYRDLLSLGVDATLVKHRPKKAQKEQRVATVGEWITAAKGVAGVNEATFNQYAASLRKITGDILSVKKTDSRFGPKSGGAAKYRASIDSASLELLTLPSIRKWRLAYVKKAKNPAEQGSRMTSCNSTIRQARSLFSGVITHCLPDLMLPSPRPFEIPNDLKRAKGKDNPLFFPRQNSRYLSKVDPRKLLQKGREDLETKEPGAFLAMLLALGAGLRRGEIDGLRWNQIDFQNATIRVEVTESASLKTQDSKGEVDIDPELASVLKRLKETAKAKSTDYVIPSDSKKDKVRGPRSWGQHYRANSAFDILSTWLRANGVSAKKPIHELRKELGALITQEHGIYAASRALRHSNVAITAAHYADKKARTTVGIGGWLNPDNSVATPSQSDTPSANKSQSTNGNEADQK